MQIGGKTKIKKAAQPQFVVQMAETLNEYLLFRVDVDNGFTINWVGDPKSASKFNSKFQAKCRVRELEGIPATRCFKELV